MLDILIGRGGAQGHGGGGWEHGQASMHHGLQTVMGAYEYGEHHVCQSTEAGLLDIPRGVEGARCRREQPVRWGTRAQ
jgi:hypothetical protein